MWISFIADILSFIFTAISENLDETGIQGIFKDLFQGLATLTSIIGNVTDILGWLGAALKDFGSIFGIGEGGSLKRKLYESGGEIKELGSGMWNWATGKKTAVGGIFTSPQMRLIGEAGPEAVIPLSQMDTMGGNGININVNGIFEEGRLRDIMRMVAEDVLQQHKQISGSVY